MSVACEMPVENFDELLGARRSSAERARGSQGCRREVRLLWNFGFALADALSPREVNHPLADQGPALCELVMRAVRGPRPHRALALALTDGELADTLIAIDWCLEHRRYEPAERNTLAGLRRLLRHAAR